MSALVVGCLVLAIALEAARRFTPSGLQREVGAVAIALIAVPTLVTALASPMMLRVLGAAALAVGLCWFLWVRWDAGRSAREARAKLDAKGRTELRKRAQPNALPVTSRQSISRPPTAPTGPP